jgi:hypothetical protein
MKSDKLKYFSLLSVGLIIAQYLPFASEIKDNTKYIIILENGGMANYTVIAVVLFFIGGCFNKNKPIILTSIAFSFLHIFSIFDLIANLSKSSNSYSLLYGFYIFILTTLFMIIYTILFTKSLNNVVTSEEDSSRDKLEEDIREEKRMIIASHILGNKSLKLYTPIALRIESNSLEITHIDENERKVKQEIIFSDIISIEDSTSMKRVGEELLEHNNEMKNLAKSLLIIHSPLIGALLPNNKDESSFSKEQMIPVNEITINYKSNDEDKKMIFQSYEENDDFINALKQELY